MTEGSDLRDSVRALQLALAAEKRERQALDARLRAINTILQPQQDTLVELTEIIAYAVRCRETEARLGDMIRHLRANSDREAQAIGNSMDTLFRAAPVPASIARR